MLNLLRELEGNTYPGRGIVIGMSEDSRYAIIAYFIMGRSENSRNRIFVERGDGIETKPFDISRVSDPSLIIYSPVRVLGDMTIVTNGDQTDTIYEYVDKGDTFESALRTRTFEPDEPNYTPRISGLVSVRDGKMKYKLSILKSAHGDADSAERFFFDYYQPIPGEGRFIHTYKQDGDPIPSFEGEPKSVRLEGSIGVLTDNIWHSLNPSNKVSLFVRYIDLVTGECHSKIMNKNRYREE